MLLGSESKKGSRSRSTEKETFITTSPGVEVKSQ